ncbi:MAG: TonB-dependent receptor [Opitutus sp.]|nr:TonB-dependent receptor [Opitutus sp.]
MTTQTSNRPHPISRWLLLAAALLAPMMGLRAQDGSLGVVTGRVVNATTAAYLEGAEVSITGVAGIAFTARDGSFSIGGVPAGAREVRVYYTGLDVETKSVDVRPGQPAEVTVALKSSIQILEAFTVSSSREGEAASITKQRNADNVKNVVSMDTFGSVADGNVGNFMVRLPGVSGEFENGEVVGLKIRGTPVEFSALNVDGVRSTGAFSGFNTQGDRGAQSDQIPAEFIKEVELTKAPTPEMMADSIGGSTNLVTKSALDFKEDVLTYRLGANYNTHRKDLKNFTPNGAMTWLTRIGAKRDIGLALSLSYTDTEAPRDRAGMQRLEADGRNTQARTLTNINRRVRAGAGLKFDYRLSDRTEVSLKFQHNYYFFDSDRLVYAASVTGARRVASYGVVSRAQIEAGAQPRDAANVQAGVAPGYTDSYTEMLNAAWSFDGDNNEKTGRQYLFDTTLRSKLSGDQNLNLQVSYAPSNFKSILRTLVATFTPGIGMGIDTRVNRSRPEFRQTYGPSILFGQTDFTRYTTQMQLQPETGAEEAGNAKADYRKRVRVLDLPVDFKAGGAFRQQHRNLFLGRPNWNLTGPDGIVGNADDNLSQFIMAQPAYTVFNSSGVWPSLPGIDFKKGWRAFNEQPQLFRPIGESVSAAPNFSDIKERILGAYAQGRVQLGALNVLTGVRFEKTDVTASGQYSDPRRPTVTRASRTSGYDQWFPSVHAKYEFRPGLIGHASFSTGAARPNMSDLYPTTTVGYNTATGLGTVTQNDPGLKPQYSRNYDVSLEYYFEPAGVISAGVFQKDIRDFIARGTEEISGGVDNGFGGDFAGFTLNTTTNQGSAKIEGFELNGSLQLTMLPKPFNGLRVFGNYTKMKTEGTYANGVTDLVAFVPETMNAGFSFLWRKLEFRTAYNFTSGFLTGFNVIEAQQTRRRPLETTDFNLQYKFSPRYALFLDVINAFNRWPEFYTARDKGRVTISDIYGTRLNMGLSGRF